jgi:antitoxin component YwqK of YwqJK toxin-antitoxin module
MFNDYIKLHLITDEIDSKILEYSEKLSEIKNEISANLKLYSKNIIDEDQYKQQMFIKQDLCKFHGAIKNHRMNFGCIYMDIIFLCYNIYVR